MDNNTSLKKIRRFYSTNKRMPSYAELMKLLGFRSKNAVFKYISKLIKQGFIEKDSTGRIIPKQLYGQLKVLGIVEAGFPSPAEEELSDTMSMDDYLIGNKEATFMLKVKGDSMIEAGIMPGDMVLVERGAQAKDGDIVIAEVDHGWTMKYLKIRNGTTILMPANPKYLPIIPEEELNVEAVVKAVVRKY